MALRLIDVVWRLLLALAVLADICTAIPLSLEQNSSIGFTNYSTGNPGKCDHPTAFFRQAVDHGRKGTNNETFLQQTQVITDFFKPGGPILAYPGQESAQSCLEVSAMYDFAQELGALLVSVEHRYFGISIPLGLNASQNNTWTPEDMRALTLDNVLADCAVIVQKVREETPGAKDSKVIAFGGSYSAFLSPQLKIRYPDIFHGAIATGGVFTGLNTSPGPNAPVSYADWVSNVYADLSFEAASIIRSGFDEVRKLMKNGSFEELHKSLNLCTTPSSDNQTSMLINAIYETYESNSQFEFAAPVLGLPAHSLQSLVNQTLNALTPLVALNYSIAALLKIDEGLEGLGALGSDAKSCLTWYSDNGPFNEADVFQDSRPYSYMVCTYYPYPEGSSSNDTIFGIISERPTVGNVNEQQCNQLFNISAKTGDEAYQKSLGLSQEQLMNEERMFFVEAQYDWVSVLGVQSWYASGNRNKSRWWYMAEAGHTDDFTKQSPYDPQTVIDTRTAQLSYMKTWLGM